MRLSIASSHLVSAGLLQIFLAPAALALETFMQCPDNDSGIFGGDDHECNYWKDNAWVTLKSGDNNPFGTSCDQFTICERQEVSAGAVAKGEETLI
jgi:hypothetical protein